MSTLGSRFCTELHDLLEVVLLPGLAAVLPWPWCFAVFQRMARWSWLYREPCQEALRQARQRGWAGENEAHWIWARRLVTLVDHADHYLGLWRSNQWMRRHMRVEGVWPAAGQRTLLTTFHWGAGYWGLRHAAAQGLRPHALVASLDTRAYQGRMVMSWYARSRNAHVARTLRASTIDVAQQLKQVIRVLRQQHDVLGVMDVPADAAVASMPIQILGMPASVPRGLLRLAVDQSLPVVLYITGLNTGTGERFLRIERLGVYPSMELLAQDVFERLEHLIASDAPAWHFWGIAERFFTPPS